MNDETLHGDSGTHPPHGEAAGEAQAAAPAARAEGTGRPLPEDALIILPVRNVVMFPGTVFPLTVGRERSRAAVQEAVRLERPIGVLLQSKPEAEEPGPDELHWVGTSAGVLRYVTTPDGTHHVIAKGLRRFRVLQFLEGHAFPAARVQYIDDPEQLDPEIEGRVRALKQRALETLQLLPQVPAEMVAALQGVEEGPQLADFIAGVMDIPLEEKQALLETFDLRARLDRLLQLLAHRIEVLKVSREVDERTSRSATSTASTCCASRCAPSRRSWAKATKGPPRSPSWRRPSPRRRCPRRWRRSPSRSSSACSACPRPRASTAWCAPISSG